MRCKTLSPLVVRFQHPGDAQGGMPPTFTSPVSGVGRVRGRGAPVRGRGGLVRGGVGGGAVPSPGVGGQGRGAEMFSQGRTLRHVTTAAETQQLPQQQVTPHSRQVLSPTKLRGANRTAAGRGVGTAVPARGTIRPAVRGRGVAARLGPPPAATGMGRGIRTSTGPDFTA